LKQTFFGIVFTFLYMLAMVRPILPVVEYYMNYDYISKELCENKDKPYLECNGTCYLEKQMSKIDPISHDQKPISNIPINLKDYPISTLDFFTFDFSGCQDTDMVALPKYCNQSDYTSFTRGLLRPPTFFA